MIQQFEKDVIAGLSSKPKQLASRYFYDSKGDRLFQQIMGLDEYYLTRSEYEVLDTNKAQICRSIRVDESPFNLLEFGAGDGFKTKVLLRQLVEQDARFTYRPIDISDNAISSLTENLLKELPGLHVAGIRNEYFSAIKALENASTRNVVLFLGSNIGNFTDDRAVVFLSELNEALHPGDMVLIGFDLKKDPRKILAAYDDSSGVTAAFNLNLLDRINRELGGNFDLDAFSHYPVYDPISGQARSYLISRKQQTVQIGEHSFEFRPWEPIHMEISRKFDPYETDALAAASGFTVVEHFFDSERNFLDTLWKK
ncbi:L-histidine N(alpha)-methyltransferase [Fulvivirga sedimenti]|uniref:L-histidine N(Alpha)-methyltransferase n=1 Tax=Fulvivirga sedimenti TaxID=2879465 RepID=A0A9X1HQY2_9BACT|nr:L-histidine N(alpha)-methyltransferase [Fulvivirga sedimenti]MCA6075497.1 L-histidine N(alpha)-methyltransferase [Fulvivirga sedimenti]MCA6076674.1 L-histidine N(alpha)-methyltransferase [Fulvivirga sedimenti]MCA6077802.1 L-histidine N(alpha)-methyltransferase [Fulvivirga sedimenti]